MNTVCFSLAAVLLASAAASAADSPVVSRNESNSNASPQFGWLEELAPAGKPVPAFDLPLVVRDEQGNVVLDARNEGPLPLGRLANAVPNSASSPSDAGPLHDVGDGREDGMGN